VLAGVGAPGGGTGGVLALTDAHGDVLGQFTAGGTGVQGSQAYDPWGTVTATHGIMAGMLGFQSAWTDPASGKDLMGARWYNPAAGDFTSADSMQVSPVPDPAAGDPFGYGGDNERRGELRCLRGPGQRGDPVVRLRRAGPADRRHRLFRRRVPVLLRRQDRDGCL
jgi:RHS repeat-associated protein